MDEQLQKQLIRQLKILNFWITTLGVLLLGGLIAVAFLLFQIISAVQSTADRIQNLQDETSKRLDVQQQLCQGNSNLSGFLRGQDLCQ